MMKEVQPETFIDLFFKSYSPNFIDTPVPIPIKQAEFAVTLKESTNQQITQKVQITHKMVTHSEIWVPQLKIRGKYSFSIVQPIYFVLQQDGLRLVGSTTLSIILGTPLRIKNVILSDSSGKHKSTIQVKGWQFHRYEQLSLVMDWKAVGLANFSSSFLKDSSAYLKFYRINQNNAFLEVDKTEVIQNTATPDWKKISIPLKTLVDLKKLLPSFQVQCYHYDKNEEEQVLIGQATVQMIKLKSGAFDQKEVFQIQPQNSSKASGSLVMTQRYLQCPQTFLHHIKKMKLGLFVGLNLKNENLLLKYLSLAQQIIEKAWEIISPFSRQPKNFYGLNISNDKNQFDETDKDEYFNSRISQNHHEQQSENSGLNKISSNEQTSSNSEQQKLKIKFDVSRQFLFQEQYGFDQPNAFITDAKRFYYDNDTWQKNKSSRLVPFLTQVGDMYDKSSHLVVYKVVLIITDNRFEDIQNAVNQMIRQQTPTSFFFIQVGGQDLQSQFSIFNQKFLTSLDGVFESDRCLTKFIKVNPNTCPITQSIHQLLADVPTQYMDYIDMFVRNSSCIDEKYIRSSTNTQKSSN